MFPKSFSTALSESPKYQALTAEIQPDRLIPSLIAGGITSIIGIIRAISYAALIFSGPLAHHLNVGVGMAILSSALISVVVALTSSLAGMIATPLAAPTLVLTALAAAIAQQLDPQATGMLPTVIAAIALGSVLTGLVLWLLGRLQWGKAMEILPYPVVGGFMAGTGLLLVRGAFKVMTGQDLTPDHLGWLVQPEHCPQWLAGLAIAAVLLWATQQFHHYLVMPGVLLLATLSFYGTIWGYQLPLDTVRDQGWLLGPFPQGSLWHPLTLESFAQVQWGTILRASPTLGLLVFISLLSLVLTNGSIELAVEKDLDLNRELKAVGLANLVAGLGSTMVGNQALPSTLLVHRLGAANRLTGVFKALPCFMVLLLGPTFLNYFPKPILGSLLLFLGINLLWQWLYDAWFRLPLMDYLTILVMLVGINTAGFIPGIGIGVGIATVQFLVQCSRLKTTARVDLTTAPVTAEPPEETPEEIPEEIPEKTAACPQEDWLNRVDCVDLQGLLFFGTAKGLCQQLSDRWLHPTPDNPPRQYLILDFAAVLTLDSSAAMGLSKLAKLAQKHDCTLVFCQLSDRYQDLLLKSQALDLEISHLCADRSEALKWCHEQLQTATAEGLAAPAAASVGSNAGVLLCEQS